MDVLTEKKYMNQLPTFADGQSCLNAHFSELLLDVTPTKFADWIEGGTNVNAADTSTGIARGNDFKSMLLGVKSANGQVSVVVALGHGYYDKVCGGRESIHCMYNFVKTWDKAVPGSMAGVVVSGIESTSTGVSTAMSAAASSKAPYSLGVTLPMASLASYQQKYSNVVDAFYLLLIDFWCPSVDSYAASNPNNIFKTQSSDLGSFMVKAGNCPGGKDSPIPQKDIIAVNSKTILLWSTRHAGVSSSQSSLSSCPYPLNDGSCTQNDRAELGTVTAVEAMNLIQYMSNLFTSAKHGFYYMSLMPDQWFYDD
ncbi:hypothetical protein FOZ62_026536 [Perkinsus olseni]|uniref:Uncharacterized protein n=1 Tax=Perkinsus olseni TaxID=32597 RepID=A0A7J6QBM1_PEROL|nr:hypothetical protein FOZ62_026536 [Perkinsus olseni]